jgi:hypothetical protein
MEYIPAGVEYGKSRFLISTDISPARQAQPYEQACQLSPSSPLPPFPLPFMPAAIIAKFTAAAATITAGADTATRTPPTNVAPIPHTAHAAAFPFDSFAIFVLL